MDITVVNLTLLKINGEIENLSGHIYPAATYHKVLNNPRLRQKLLTYILDRMPNSYAAINSEKIITISPASLYCSNREKIEIKQLVQQGVVYLILSELNKSASINQRDAV
ncbi:MAG TPA: hypothetical protein V6D26_04475 [Stenomitos sp.]